MYDAKHKIRLDRTKMWTLSAYHASSVHISHRKNVKKTDFVRDFSQNWKFALRDPICFWKICTIRQQNDLTKYEGNFLSSLFTSRASYQLTIWKEAITITNMKLHIPQLLLAGFALLFSSAKAQFEGDDIQDHDGHPGKRYSSLVLATVFLIFVAFSRHFLLPLLPS